MEKERNIHQIHDLKAVLGVLIILVIVAVITVVKTTSGTHTVHSNPNGGSVTLTAELRGSKIALDQIAEYTTAKDGDAYTATNLENRPYQFAVVRDGYWPWAKTLTPKEGENIVLDTFSISMSPKKTNIASGESMYKEYKPKFDEMKVPNENTKIISKDGKMAMWAVQNTIFAEWLGDASSTPSYFCAEGNCATLYTVIGLQYNVRSLSFLGEHNSVIIFADDQGIYAIDFEQRDRQNFQPVYKTAIPQFIVLDTRTLLVESKGDMFKLGF